MDAVARLTHNVGMKAPCVLLLCLAGCSDIPRDPDDTLERVRSDRVIRVARVDGALPGDLSRGRAVLARLEAATGATAAVRPDRQEPALLALEAGEVDLVVGGRFDAKTPWKTRVTLGPPFDRRETPAGKTASHVVARNGENAWIMLVQREARAAGAER